MPNDPLLPIPAALRPPAAPPRPDALPGPYITQLSPQAEQQFQGWVKQTRAPWQDGPTSDYDMRGYWQALQHGDPNAHQGANLHYPDTYKTPYHRSFSNESQYAIPSAAPGWQGNTLIAPNKQVVWDDSWSKSHPTLPWTQDQGPFSGLGKK